MDLISMPFPAPVMPNTHMWGDLVRFGSTNTVLPEMRSTPSM